MTPKSTSDKIEARLTAAFRSHDVLAALKYARQLVQCLPTSGVAHINLAVVLASLRRLEEAAEVASNASRLDPRNPAVGVGRARVELSRGNWDLGWRLFEARLYQPNARSFVFASAPPSPWQGEPLTGRRILLRWEEGFGDTIQMLRYVPRLIAAGAQVVLDVQKPLVDMAELLAPSIGTSDGEAVDVAADFWAPLFSLPRLCGETLSEPAAPYLSPPRGVVEETLRRLDGLPRPLIAVQWRGSAHHAKDRIRSLPAKVLFRALDGLPGTLVSLQIEPRADETLPSGMVQAEPGFVSMAALMSVCDAVVSVDTAMAHLAGAVGCPVHVLIAHDADWRWLSSQSSNWYASARLHHQVRPGDWAAPLAAVRQALVG